MMSKTFNLFSSIAIRKISITLNRSSTRSYAVKSPNPNDSSNPVCSAKIASPNPPPIKATTLNEGICNNSSNISTNNAAFLESK